MPNARTKKTYKFSKASRTKTTNKIPHIPMSVWNKELQRSNGARAEEISESDYCAMEPIHQPKKIN